MLLGRDYPSASLEAGKKQSISSLLGNNPMPKTFVSFHGAVDAGQRIFCRGHHWSFLASQTLYLQGQLNTCGRDYVIAHGTCGK